MLLEHKRCYGLGLDAPVGIDAVVTVCSKRAHTTMHGFGLGCSVHRMLLQRERYYCLDMDALLTKCSGNGEHKDYSGLGTDVLVTTYSKTTNVCLIWAPMLWSPLCSRKMNIDIMA